MPNPGDSDTARCPICRELMLRLSNAVRQLARMNSQFSGALVDWDLGLSPEPDSKLLDYARVLREEAATTRADLQHHRALHHWTGVSSRSRTAMP